MLKEAKAEETLRLQRQKHHEKQRSSKWFDVDASKAAIEFRVDFGKDETDNPVFEKGEEDL